MTSLKLSLSIGSIALTGLGILLSLTNPGQKAYEKYASQTLNVYLKENVCTQLPPEISKFLQSHCHSLVDTIRPQLSQIIARQTTRQNFILFSIYQTDLSIPASLPDYQVRTIGILKQFFIYESEQL
ncbi:MAG: DUF4359 domain-containing protein [Xenococcaceae cyanobacterium MO_188.B32]|nr:DUF4359 domain-containing protein [Xenococcaceae cyanobacterium MO_188.B32]